MNEAVNPISAVTWSWRALRGHSLTFAVLFAFSILGISVLAVVRNVLSRGGAPWYIWMIAPMILVTVLAKKEVDWLPDPVERKKWARRIFFGSIVISIVIAFFRPAPPPAPVPATPTFHKAVR